MYVLKNEMTMYVLKDTMYLGFFTFTDVKGTRFAALSCNDLCLSCTALRYTCVSELNLGGSLPRRLPWYIVMLALPIQICSSGFEINAS